MTIINIDYYLKYIKYKNKYNIIKQNIYGGSDYSLFKLFPYNKYVNYMSKPSILSLSLSLLQDRNNPIIILEIGAGTGCISTFICKNKLNKINRTIHYYITDFGSESHFLNDINCSSLSNIIVHRLYGIDANNLHTPKIHRNGHPINSHYIYFFKKVHMVNNYFNITYGKIRFIKNIIFYTNYILS